MHDHSNHEHLLEGFCTAQKEIIENSDQAVYVFLDDENKASNLKFAKLLGYDSEKEWAKTGGNFLEAFVAENSRELLASTYGNAMEKLAGEKIKVTWKKKSGGTVDTNVILVPLMHEGHVFALHFVAKV